MKVEVDKTESVALVEIRDEDVYMTGEVQIVFDSKAFKKKVEGRLIDKWPIKINGQPTTKAEFIVILQAVYDA